MVRRITFAMVAAALAAVVAGGRAAAQSLSDMDLSTFEQQTSAEVGQAHTDPFASGVSTAEDLVVEDLQLTGIVYRSEAEAYALISGYLVRPGDRIAGYRIDTIEKDRVKLRRFGEVIVLALGGGI